MDECKALADGSLQRTLEGPGGGLEWVSWHPKGNVVLAGSEDFTAGGVYTWNKSVAGCVFGLTTESLLCFIITQ